MTGEVMPTVRGLATGRENESGKWENEGRTAHLTAHPDIGDVLDAARGSSDEFTLSDLVNALCDADRSNVSQKINRLERQGYVCTIRSYRAGNAVVKVWRCIG